MANGDQLVVYPPGFEPPDPGPPPVVGSPSGSFPGGVGTDPGIGGPVGGAPVFGEANDPYAGVEGDPFWFDNAFIANRPETLPINLPADPSDWVQYAVDQVPASVPPADRERYAWLYWSQLNRIADPEWGDTYSEPAPGINWFTNLTGYHPLPQFASDPSRYNPAVRIPGATWSVEGQSLADFGQAEVLLPQPPPAQEQEMSQMPGGPRIDFGLGDLIGDVVGGIFAPDTPGPQVNQEREDQWWDAPLDWIGDLATDAARAWARRGIDWIEGEIFPPGQAPGRTQPGGGLIPDRRPPGLAPGNQFTRPDDPWVAPVDPNLYPPATRPALGGQRQMPSVPTSMPGGAPLLGSGSSTSGSPWCITPGGASITQRPAMGMRLPSRVDVPTVDRSGNVRFTTFKNMGRPLLWSGDLAASKRVRKVAAKARRAKGR